MFQFGTAEPLTTLRLQKTSEVILQKTSLFSMKRSLKMSRYFSECALVFWICCLNIMFRVETAAKSGFSVVNYQFCAIHSAVVSVLQINEWTHLKGNTCYEKGLEVNFLWKLLSHLLQNFCPALDIWCQTTGLFVLWWLVGIGFKLNKRLSQEMCSRWS